MLYHAYLYDGMGNQVRDILGGTSYSIYDGHNTKLAKYSIQSLTGARVSEALSCLNR